MDVYTASVYTLSSLNMCAPPGRPSLLSARPPLPADSSHRGASGHPSFNLLDLNFPRSAKRLPFRLPQLGHVKAVLPSLRPKFWCRFQFCSLSSHPSSSSPNPILQLYGSSESVSTDRRMDAQGVVYPCNRMSGSLGKKEGHRTPATMWMGLEDLMRSSNFAR